MPVPVTVVLAGTPEFQTTPLVVKVQVPDPIAIVFEVDALLNKGPLRVTLYVDASKVPDTI